MKTEQIIIKEISDKMDNLEIEMFNEEPFTRNYFDAFSDIKTILLDMQRKYK